MTDYETKCRCPKCHESFGELTLSKIVGYLVEAGWTIHNPLPESGCPGCGSTSDSSWLHVTKANRPNDCMQVPRLENARDWMRRAVETLFDIAHLEGRSVREVAIDMGCFGG